MSVTYKGVVRGRVIVLEGGRYKEACERLEVLADRIDRMTKSSLNLGDDVIEARRDLEERV